MRGPIMHHRLHHWSVRLTAARRRMACAGVAALALALLGGGCATPEPPRQEIRHEVEAVLPGPHPPDLIPDTLAALRRPFPDEAVDSLEEAPAGMQDDCACTLEYRMNLCVTVNGTETFSDAMAGLSFSRERAGGAAADTLSAADVAGGGRCFGEARGVQRVLMLREAVVLDSSAWFEVRTVDCCHGEARTVDFVVK